MKRLHPIVMLMSLLLAATGLRGQGLRLQDCQQMARGNYPQIQQADLIGRSIAITVENINQSYLPQVSLKGQATYQSDVTALPIQLPGIEVDPPPRDQYKLYGEVNQPLSDLLTVKHQRNLAQTQGEVQAGQLQAELYQLRDRINSLFFGVLMIDAQLEQMALLREELNASLKKLQAAVDNGVALPSQARQLDIELIKVEQKVIELTTSRQTFVDMLGQFIGKELAPDVVLAPPVRREQSLSLNRPELSLFGSQRRLLDRQLDLLNVRNRPHFNFFFQGGLGRPALNFLSPELQAYYVTGFRLQWDLTGYYTLNRDRQLIALQQEIIDRQRETFEFNLQLQLSQQSREIRKYEDLMKNDEAIIALQLEVVTTAKEQLTYGTITTTEYISTLNALSQARLLLAVHRVQLLMAQEKISFTTGN